MNFKEWLTIIESLDPNIEIKLRNFINNPKNPQDKKTQAEDELNRMKSDPNPFDNATAFANINAIFGIQKKDKPVSQEDTFRKNWQDRGSTEEELKTYDFFKNEPKQSLTEMMELLRKFIEKELITIKFENNKPVLVRNTLQGEQKLEAPDFTRFMSQLHGIESSLTQYSGKGNYFNPIEEELNHSENLAAKGDNVWVFKGHAPDICRIYGKNQKWCISSSQSAAHWFSYRMDHHQTQYFVFDFNKDENDPARYVNPGVAPKGMYSEWVDARNQHTKDPEDPNSEVGINGYGSINEYKRYLASKGIPLNIWKTTKPEQWEKRLNDYQENRYFLRAKNDPDPRVFPMYLKIVSEMNDEDFDSLDDNQKIEFVMGKVDNLTKKQFEYANNVKGYYNSLQIDDKIKFAIRTSDFKLIEQLIEKDDQVRFNAVYYAAEKGHLDIVKYLVEKGAEIDRYAVLYAASYGHLDIVKYLVEKGIEIDGNAVASAAHYGHLDVVKYLVEEKGAEIDRYALENATKNGHLDIVKYFVEKGAEIGYFAVKYAIENGHLDVVKYLVEEKGAEIGCYTVNYSAEKGHLDIVKYLVENGVNIGDAVENAARGGHLDIVKYLVEKGANIRDAVDYAASNGNLDIVKYLVEKGAKIENAVEYAAEKGHLDIVKYLVENGAKIGDEAVANAAHYDHLDIVKYLVGNGANIGYAVLQAASDGHLDIVKYLVENGGFIGYNAVENAARGGHLDVVKYLVEEKGANIGDAVYYAANNGHLDIVKYLEKQKNILKNKK